MVTTSSSLLKDPVSVLVLEAVYPVRRFWLFWQSLADTLMQRYELHCHRFLHILNTILSFEEMSLRCLCLFIRHYSYSIQEQFVLSWKSSFHIKPPPPYSYSSSSSSSSSTGSAVLYGTWPPWWFCLRYSYQVFFFHYASTLNNFTYFITLRNKPP